MPIGINPGVPCGTGGIDWPAASGPVSTALDLSLVVRKVEGFVMQVGEATEAAADDGPLDAWLRHALQQSFRATLYKARPADLLALVAGQPPSRGLPMAGGNERLIGRPGKACKGR